MGHVKRLGRELATLVVRRPYLGRSRLLRAYVPLKARQAWPLHSNIGRERSVHIVGRTVHYHDYHALVFMFEEIYIDEVYRFSCNRLDPLIIDCGSNIGLSVLYFKALFPDSTILAFEPEPRSYECLTKNIRENQLDRVTVHDCALLDRPGAVALSSTGGSLRTRVGGTSHNGFQNANAEVLSRYIKSKVDFLKLDIEGAEVPVLKELAHSGKLELVDQMVIEFHHHLETPTASRSLSLRGLLEILEEHQFDYQVGAPPTGTWSPGAFQDILVFAYREARSTVS